MTFLAQVTLIQLNKCHQIIYKLQKFHERRTFNKKAGHF